MTDPSLNSTPKEAEDFKFPEKEEKKYSPTIQSIIDGKAKVAFLSDNLEERIVNGKKWIGHTYTYEVALPHPIKEGEEWKTEIMVWDHHTVHHNERGWQEFPKTQIYINTGQGEMHLTKDPDAVNAIVDAIHCQVNN
jgi:hypothetical protein